MPNEALHRPPKNRRAAIGLELKEQHIKQAVDYAANQGCDWVALTNGASWRVYRVTFSKPIEHELIVDLDLLAVNPRNPEHIELVGLLAKEGWQKAHLGEYQRRRQALNRFTLAALILSDPLLDVLRREVRWLCPNVRVETEQIKNVLVADVLKREVLEGEKAEVAGKQVAKAAGEGREVTGRVWTTGCRRRVGNPPRDPVRSLPCLTGRCTGRAKRRRAGERQNC